MGRRNYKVYANVGFTRQTLQRTLTILDTGAGSSFVHKRMLPPKVLDSLDNGPFWDVVDANGKPITTIGSVTFIVRLGPYAVAHRFIVCDNLAAPLILGTDFCDTYVEAIRPKKKVVELDDGTTIPIVRRALKSALARDLPPIPTGQQDPKGNGRTSSKVRCAEATMIPAQSQRWVKVTTERHGLTIIEPNPSRVELVSANGVAEVRPHRPFHILVANFSKSPRGIPKGQCVASAGPHPDFLVDTKLSTADVLGLIPDRSQSPYIKGEENQAVPNPSPPEAKISAADLDLSYVPDRYRERLRAILLKHDDMWDGHLGEITAVQHHIDLKPGARPHMARPFRAGPKAREFVQEEVKRMLKAGVIEPSQSEWAAPVVIAPKSDGTLRFCVDFRKLNEMTVRDTYPLPRMDDCIDSLGDATVFSTLDANWGYWQVNIAPRDWDKTTFTSHVGTYRFKRMPFGLTNAPATFQRTLDIILNRYTWRTCLVYLDDIIIFSKDKEQHLLDIDAILSALKRAGISLKLKKCAWFTTSVRYLGHIIRPGQLCINEAMSKSLKEAQHPTSQTELRSFLGLCNVYRRFVKDFSRRAAPLNDLLRKGQPAKLGPLTSEQAAAFKDLVEAVTSPPVLALPRSDLPFSVDTDASERQLGAVLFQTYPDGNRKPLGYWSRSMNNHEVNYGTPEKECLAVVWALQTLRPYLQGTSFVVHSDHSALRWLMEIVEPSGRLMRWRLRLSEFDFRIEYKKGTLNAQADALSRLRTLGETTVPIDDDIPSFFLEEVGKTVREDLIDDAYLLNNDLEVSDAQLLLTEETPREYDALPISEDELLQEQTSDNFCKKQKAAVRNGVNVNFVIGKNGILYRVTNGDPQIVVPLPLRDRVLRLSHYAKLAGHPGGRRLYHTLRRSFYWPTMAADCYTVAADCSECAKNRVAVRQHGHKMKLFPAQAPLEFVSIDILGELMKTPRGNRFLLVIADRFSKLVRTVPLKSTSGAAIAQAFVTHWVLPYGAPLKLLSDNGKQFTARFFQRVCNLLGVKNVYTTTYHPQTNGQVERFNRTLLAGIRSYSVEHPKDWDLYTDVLTYAYNSQENRMTRCTPFELVLSRPPPPLALTPKPQGVVGESPSDYNARWMSWLQLLLERSSRTLYREQARYKRNYDARVRTTREKLHAGTQVFVRREYFKEGKHKLSPLADGPFWVVDVDDETAVVRIGDQDERVSRDRLALAPAIAADTQRENPTSNSNSNHNLSSGNAMGDSNTQQAVIDRIVDHKLTFRGTPRYRVRWYGYDAADDTWEPARHLPRSSILRYYRRRRLTAPEVALQASQPG